MIETVLDRIDSSIERLNKKHYGVVTGRVINILDPLMLGRVQVQLPFNQAAVYNMTLGARYVAVTNGMVQYCFEALTQPGAEVKFLETFPGFT